MSNGVERELILSPVTKEIFDSTKEGWIRTLSELEDRIEVTRYYSTLRDLEDSAENQDPLNSDIVRYVLHQEGSAVAQSALDVSHVRHGPDAPRKKVLDICMHPVFDLDAYDEVGTEFLDEFLFVIRHSVIEALRLIFGEDPANEIKLYGRTEQMHGYFQAMATGLSKDGGIEGRILKNGEMRLKELKQFGDSFFIRIRLYVQIM